MKIQFSATAQQFSSFWILKLYYSTLNDACEKCGDYETYDFLPNDFVTSGREREDFELAVGLIADDLFMDFMNQRSAFDPRQNNNTGHAYFIYRPKSKADEAEFIVKVNALDGMIFDV
jgi:hypothetical protein